MEKDKLEELKDEAIDEVAGGYRTPKPAPPRVSVILGEKGEVMSEKGEKNFILPGENV